MKRVYLAAIALFLLPLVLYYPALRFTAIGPDNYYAARFFKSGTPAQMLREIWSHPYYSDYIPVTLSTVWLDQILWGADPGAGARLHQILWFAIGVLAVGALAARLTGRPRLALLVAALYAVHPVCSESVLWLAQRKALVALAATLWSFVLYLKAQRTEDPGYRRRAYFISLALFVVALLSKVHAVALPVVLTLHAVLLGKEQTHRRFLELLPFGLIAALCVIGNFLWVRFDLHHEPPGMGRAARLWIDGPILLFYIKNTLWPTHLALYEPAPIYAAQDPSCAGAWVMVAGALALPWILARQRRLVGFCLFAGLAALLPALNLTPQPIPVSDHYHLWALPFWLLGLVLAIRDRLPAVSGGLVLCLFAIAWLTLLFARIPDFRTDLDLALADAERQPCAWGTWLRVAQLLGAQTPPQTDEAGGAALRALQASDNIRMQDQQRSMMTLSAAVYLIRIGQTKQAKTLVQQQLRQISTTEIPWIRGQLQLLSADFLGAAATMKPTFVDVMQQAARILRRRCRGTGVVPWEFPPVLRLQRPAADAFLDEVLNEENKTSLSILARAYLALGRLEDAFDVAAVACNLFHEDVGLRHLMKSIYTALGETRLAARIVEPGTTAPAKPD